MSNDIDNIHHHSISLLPLEILNEIFVNLKFNNKKSYLYNCALVNRTWCLLTVPNIWDKPFNVNIKKNFQIKCEKYDKFNNIIEIYTRLLDENTKLQLGLFNRTEKLLFNYCEFMKEFDYSGLFITVINWTANKYFINENKKLNQTREIEINEKSYYLTCELLKLFVKNCTKLSFISIDSTKYENIISSQTFNNCFQFNKYNCNSFSQIKSVNIGEIYNKVCFIKYLSIKCNLIEEIIIRLSDNDSKCMIDGILKELIIKQKYLKKFFCISSVNSSFNATRIIEALNYKEYEYYRNLSYIEFSRCQFDNEINLFRISCFNNLKFILINCKLYNSESDNYDILDENFITNYFNYIPENINFDFDEDKKSNTIILRNKIE